jgi:hypothetical protein
VAYDACGPITVEVEKSVGSAWRTTSCFPRATVDWGGGVSLGVMGPTVGEHGVVVVERTRLRTVTVMLYPQEQKLVDRLFVVFLR